MCGIKFKDSLEYTIVKSNLAEEKCLFCDKICQNNFVTCNTYKLFSHDINKSIVLLQKGVYPCKYMDDLEKFNKTPLLEKEDFYGHLNIEDITDADYTHTKRV